MRTHKGEEFPSWFYFAFFWCLLFLMGCNPESDIPVSLQGQLSIEKVNAPDSIVSQQKTEIDLTIKNTGLSTATLDSFSITKGEEYFSLIGGSCDESVSELAINESCSYLVEFNPPNSGVFELGFEVSYSSVGSDQLKKLNASLSFTAESAQEFRPGELAVVEPLVHGETLVGTTSEITYTLKNIGTEKVRIDEYYLENSGSEFVIAGTTCRVDSIIEAGETCTVMVSFAPKTAGTVSQNVVVIGHYPGDTWDWKALNITLQGKGITDEGDGDDGDQTPTDPPAPEPEPTPSPDPEPIPGFKTGRLHVDGRYIKDEDGNIVVLKGVNVADPEHLNLKPWERPGVTAMSVVKDAVENYHAKVIRLPIHPGHPSYPNEGFFGSNGRQKYIDDHVKPLVDYLTSMKVYTIIDLHYVDNWDGKRPRVQEFWDLVAPQFKDNPYVIYEIFNEPIYPDNWDAWKDYIAQPAVDLIRGHAPDNLIIVGGPLWSAHMAGAADNPVSGSNLVYTAHIYSNQRPNHISKNFGRTVEELPVFVTEWGFETGGTEGGNKSGYGVPFEQWMQEHKFSWTAWCFDNKWGPRMFDSNWRLLGGDGGMGEFVKELLRVNHLNFYQ